MYCIIKCIVQGKQARVKNADLRHPSLHSCNVKTQICVTRPQCVNLSLTLEFKFQLLSWTEYLRFAIDFNALKVCTVYRGRHWNFKLLED